MVARWICNQKVSGSNPVTVILRTSVLWIFSNFQDKKLTLPPLMRCLARSEEATQDAIKADFLSSQKPLAAS